MTSTRTSFRFLPIGLSLVVLSLGASIASADEEPKSASDTEPKKTKVAGVLEAFQVQEVAAKTEQIDSLKIKQIVPHGSEVRKGKNLVWFETEDIDKKIKDAEIDLRLAKLAHDDEEFKYDQFLKTQRLDKAKTERSRKEAQQAFDNFVEVDRERQIETAEYNLRSSQNSLEYAMEELEQLEQMYKEDDLTEESEEIVLKRAQRSVESAQFRLEGTEIQSKRTLDQTIPKSQADQDDVLARAEMTYQKAIRDLSSARQRRDIEIDRKRDKLKEQEQELAELKAERKRLTLASPLSGIALHGKLNRSKMSEKPSVLEEGSKVTPQTVLVTVVDPSKLRIRVDLAEEHLSTVTEGTTCKVTFKAFPDYETTGVVKAVSSVPYAGTKYDCVVMMRQSKSSPQLRPTMTCELHFESSKKTSNGDESDKKDKNDGEEEQDVNRPKNKGNKSKQATKE